MISSENLLNHLYNVQNIQSLYLHRHIQLIRSHKVGKD